MRGVGAGLIVFLIVTGVLLHQVSSGDSGVAVSAGAAPSATPAERLAETALATPTDRAVPPTAQATSTATTTAPTPTVEWPTLASEPAGKPDIALADDAEPATVEPMMEDEGTALDDEPAVESASTSDDGAPELAAFDGDGEWAGAIETPNGGLIGMVAPGLANIRSLPTLDAEVVGELYGGWPVAIYGATSGEAIGGSDLWYQVAGGGYIAAALVVPFVPSQPETYYAGHWVDVDLTRNVAVAYVDNVPVNAVIIISGKPGFETPVGAHTIFSRVESETLDSTTVGIGVDDPEYYYLPDVPYTQYFAEHGFAIHANYWSDRWQFGTATSHGCVNMFEEDAAWFWWFLDLGSVVNVHY